MGTEERKVGSVTYREVGDEYFQKRGLKRHAAFWGLWSLGVGAVISGDYYGWNLGLAEGGFGGLLIATVVVAIMYYGLCFSIAEMSPALPHTGGAYSFARSAMGPWGGFITGLAENMEYVITPAVVVGAIGALMQVIMAGLFDIVGNPWWNSQPFWWAVFYVIFVGINILGIAATMRFTVVINALALGILAFFYISVLVSGSFDMDLWFNIEPDPGGSTFLPRGIAGIFPALPFAIWFYLAIEELPLAAEESHDPRRDVARATIWGMTTLLVTSVLTLTLNTGVDGGAEVVGTSATPLFEGFKGVFGDGTAAELLALIGVTGLVASFFTIIYAYGRNTFSLSRAGYFPKWLSVTHRKRKSPHVALIGGAIVGYILAYVIYYFGTLRGDPSAAVVGALLYMAVFGAVISYFMQCISFIMLRRRLPNIERPYRSPVGQWGAGIAAVIAFVCLVSLYLNEAYRPGVVGTLIYFVVGILYFAIFGRHRLVLSPEEEFALTRGERGIPAEAGYATSREEQETILRGGSGDTPPQAPSGGEESRSTVRSGGREHPPLRSAREEEDRVSGNLDIKTLEDMAEAGEIDTVLCMFTDLQGRFMGKRIVPSFFLEEVMGEEGLHACLYLLAIDMEMEPLPDYKYASWETGYGDFKLIPDLSTLRLVPWIEKTAMVICDVADEETGEPVEVAPRQILKRQVERARQAGYTFKGGSELEFYLFKDTYEEAAEKRYKDLRPSSTYIMDYHMLQTTKDEWLIRQIRNDMVGAGIPIEFSKGEFGRGQHEINITYADALETADRHALYKHGVKEIAAMNGAAITFMAKWTIAEAGSSCHVHSSVWNEEGTESLMWEENDPHHMSETFRHFLGGLMGTAREMTWMYAPFVNSYKRYQLGSWAPTAIVWSRDNRTVGFRTVGEHKSHRVESRLPGADMNPYLGYAATIAGGLYGIQNRVERPEMFVGNAYEAKDVARLPSSLHEAVDVFAGSRVAREAFGDFVFEHLLNTARQEQVIFDNTVVTDWELERYFERG